MQLRADSFVKLDIATSFPQFLGTRDGGFYIFDHTSQLTFLDKMLNVVRSTELDPLIRAPLTQVYASPGGMHAIHQGGVQFSTFDLKGTHQNRRMSRAFVYLDKDQKLELRPVSDDMQGTFLVWSKGTNTHNWPLVQPDHPNQIGTFHWTVFVQNGHALVLSTYGHENRFHFFLLNEQGQFLNGGERSLAIPADKVEMPSAHAPQLKPLFSGWTWHHRFGLTLTEIPQSGGSLRTLQTFNIERNSWQVIELKIPNGRNLSHIIPFDDTRFLTYDLHHHAWFLFEML